MLNDYYINYIAYWLSPVDGLWQDIFSTISAKLSHAHTLVLQEFGPRGIIVLALFILFLLLIVIIYVKSLIATFRSHPSETSQTSEIAAQPTETEGLYYTIDSEPSGSANDNEPQTPLYDEEEKERIDEERAISAELVRISQKIAQDTPNDAALKQKMQNDAGKESNTLKDISADLSASLADTQTYIAGKIEDLVAVILNLLGKGVSEAKTVQALFFYYKSKFSEEDIFQIVYTVRDFIGLCNAGKFDILADKNELPIPQDAVLELAKGNSTPCLVLLQSLLNKQMQLAEEETGNIQDLNYAIAANYACLIGNLARLTDNDLAHDSFELATEISPKNVKAWNRLGDIYMLKNMPEKAFISFQNVLDIGDPIMFAPQIADAQNYLAGYFEKTGLKEKAIELRQKSDRFYDIYGTRIPLSPAEQKVFQSIMRQSAENLQTSINTLFNNVR